MKQFVIFLLMLTTMGCTNYLMNNNSDYNHDTINDYDINGYTPLMAAIREHDFNLVILLIKKGADINKPKGDESFFVFNIEDRPDTNTPLIMLLYGYEVAQRELRQYIAIKDECIKTSIDCDSYYEDINFYKKEIDEYNKILDILLLQEINIDYTNDTKKSAIFFTTEKTVIKKLLKKGANINQQDCEGNTVLMYADNYDLMKFLLENGADPTIKNNDNETVLDLLKEDGDVESLKMIDLLKKYLK